MRAAATVGEAMAVATVVVVKGVAMVVEGMLVETVVVAVKAAARVEEVTAMEAKEVVMGVGAMGERARAGVWLPTS